MCIGTGLAEAFSTFLGPEDGDEAGATPRFMWNEDHLGATWPKQSRILQKSGRCPWKVVRNSAGCEKGRTSVEVDVPDVSLDAKIQGTYGCRLTLAGENCGKNHSVENMGRNLSLFVSIATAPWNHAHCLEFVTVCPQCSTCALSVVASA